MWELIVAAGAGLVAVVSTMAWLRARRAVARVLQERGWLLERERESAAQGAVDAERARISRELHDIVSHNVSLMVVQAGAAREVLAAAGAATGPGAEADEAARQATEALRAVETAGRNTMTELRHLLGVLAPAADGHDELDVSPQPSLSRLSPLIDRIAFAGLPVEVRISGEPRALPGGVDLTAYRIIQEALTNALRHGDKAKAEVTVRYTDHYLRVEVLNSGPSVLSGGRTPAPASKAEARGLLGLRQRVAVYGGDLDARRRIGGGFRVRAKIPLERP